MENRFVITDIKRIIYVSNEEYPEKVTHFTMPRVYNELIFNLSGENIVYFNGKNLYNLPDTIRFLPEGEVTEYTVNRTERGSCIDIVFTADREIEKEAFVTTVQKSAKIRALFKKAFSIWVAKNEGYYFDCLSLIYKIFAEMQKENYLPEKDFEKIKPALEYIDSTFPNTDLSAEQLASICGISYSYLKSLFIKRFGFPPKRYIIRLKINYACNLLSSGQYTISQVAEAAGYPDIYFFSRQFKEYMGISPTEYINKYKSSK